MGNRSANLCALVPPGLETEITGISSELSLWNFNGNESLFIDISGIGRLCDLFTTIERSSGHP